MAIFEWRKFNFFDLKAGVDAGNIKEIISDDEQITTTTYGNGQVIIGDSQGLVHVFRNNWKSVSFKAHNGPVLLSKFCKSNSLLVTVGADEANNDIPSFKVWNLSKPLLEGQTPLCVRTCKIALQSPTALDISENGQFMAIGFNGGGVSLYKGDIARDRSNNCKSLNTLTAITGIAFRAMGKVTQMYVCSKSDVLVYNISGRDKEQKVVLEQQDTKPGPIRCCTLQPGGDKYFIVGRDAAIFCYTSDYKGPCYVLDGEKSLMDSFRTYIIIISRPTKKGISSQKDSILTVIDIKNKFIVYSSPIDRVAAIIMEFGSCYVLTEQKELFHLDEKDLQAKLSLLLKKNLLDIAVHVAKSGDYDAENLADMIRQYGDHLYSKNDFQGAIDQYIKIIDHLEPSYVIMKYLDSRHIDCLTLYLEQLHRCGKATADHTTLLLYCFTRLDRVNDVKKFLQDDQNPEIMFDMDIAIQVLRTASVEEALELAKRSNRHKHCISVLIEDLQQYEEALKYIAALDVEEAESNLSRYGGELMRNCPKHTTGLLKRICAEYCNKKGDVMELESVFDVAPKRGEPENYLHLFVDAPEYLTEFLEYLIEHLPKCSSKSVFNALIENYLEQWSKEPLKETREAEELSKKILDLLLKHYATVDQSQVLVLCKLHDFLPGILWVYEEEKLYHLIVRHYMKQGEYNMLLDTCGRLGKLRPNLWLQALTGLRNDPKAPEGMLTVVLNVIGQQKLQSPLQVLNCLVADGGGGPQFSEVKNYFLQIFNKEDENFRREAEQVEKNRQEGQQWKVHIRRLQEQPIEFMASNCDNCGQPLSNPTIHFFCQHSFHQDCVRGYSESEKDCPVCHTKNAGIRDKLKAQQESRTQHQKFHDLLNRSAEPFSEVAKYFGHGLFNQIMVFDENDLKVTPERRKVTTGDSGTTTMKQSGGSGGIMSVAAASAVPPVKTSYGTGAEAKMRLAEGRSNVMAAPVSEARMRLQEQRVNRTNNAYSSSLEANVEWSGNRRAGAADRSSRVNPSPVPVPTATVAPVVRTSSSQPVKKQVPVATAPPAKNNYPKSNNPFGDEEGGEASAAAVAPPKREYDKALDPFADDTEQDEDVNNNYDKSLNPFE